MPQLAKGGKFVFGWCRIGEDGGAVIPPQARGEYGISPGDRIILLSGSSTSGGFGITTKSFLEKSRLSVILADNPELADCNVGEGQPLKYKGRDYCWATVNGEGKFIIPPRALEAYGIKVGDRLLSIRSSAIAIGMAAKGPLVELAEKHAEIEVF
jgi:bifunctional DNA-binding transcriptional regulator/antitoxin component of YhaV-PrlF toxin-antitoxin module